MIISIGTEKSFDKTQHLLMIKILSRLGIEGNFLNLLKVTCRRPYHCIPIGMAKIKEA